MCTLYTVRCNTVNTLGCLTPYRGTDTFGSMTLANRIKAAREHAGLTQIELSKKVGLPQQVISKLEKGIQQETASLIKIAVACGVDPIWLDSGEGNMLTYARDPKIQAVLQAMERLPEYKKDILVQTSIALAEQPKHKNNGTQ